jgi:mediator of RNA polymerase II transcription subunit 13, fungi type
MLKQCSLICSTLYSSRKELLNDNLASWRAMKVPQGIMLHLYLLHRSSLNKFASRAMVSYLGFVLLPLIQPDSTKSLLLNAVFGQGNSLIDDRLASTQALTRFQTRVKTILGVDESYSLIKFATIADGSNDQSQKGGVAKANMPKAPVQQRPEPIMSGKKTFTHLTVLTVLGFLFRLPTPLVRIRRNDALWDVLPPAINFWNTLGLAPSSGPKNVAAYAICPVISGTQDALSAFITELGLSYESCKLGSHSRGDAVSDSVDSLIPWSLAESAVGDSFEVLDSILATLGADLFRLSKDHKNIGDEKLKSNVDATVIYVVDPYEEPETVTSIASSFNELLDVYRKDSPRGLSKKAVKNIILQIIPLSLILGKGGVVIHSTRQLQNLAREVYNKSPKAQAFEDSLDLSICSNSSIRLADSLPRKIPFELVVDPPSNVMLDNSQLHIAYAHSSSSNWIVASLTDNTGRNQSVVSYCTAGKRTFLEVATEIWQTCIQIMQVRKVNWRLCIAKAGIITTEELDGMYLLHSKLC